MHFSTVIAATAVVGTALAADHSVKVGGNNNELTFTPNNINASTGDTVTFHFWPKNHSVAQATFAKPCEPSDNGFWSGYIASSSGGAEETFMYEVQDDSKPVWFYCTQAAHCQDGMVGAINAPTTGNTIQKFVAAAKNADTIVIPSSAAGEGGLLMNGSMSASSSASGASASSTGAASTLEVSRGLVGASLLGMFGYLLI